MSAGGQGGVCHGKGPHAAVGRAGKIEPRGGTRGSGGYLLGPGLGGQAACGAWGSRRGQLPERATEEPGKSHEAVASIGPPQHLVGGGRGGSDGRGVLSRSAGWQLGTGRSWQERVAEGARGQAGPLWDLASCLSPPRAAQARGERRLCHFRLGVSS